MAYLCLAVMFICLAKSVHSVDKCSPPITDDHLKYLDEMIDAQLNTSCSVKVKLIDSKQVEGYCYKRGVISQLSNLLESLEFKPNSQSYNHTKILNKLYSQRFMDCVGDSDDITEEEISPCSHYIDLSPAQILERVKISFVIFRDFKNNSTAEKKCSNEYKLCSGDYDPVTKGPQCACPSPTTPMLSGTATQKSLSNLSEIKSSLYTSMTPFSTVPLTEYMSGTDSHDHHQSSESIEMSSVNITSIPTIVQPLTTIKDHLNAATTDRLISGPESAHTKMDISFHGMEFTKSITESTNSMSLSQTRTYPEYFNIESLNTDGSHAETLPTTATVLNEDVFELTGELTSVTEPVVDELLETTALHIVSQSSVSNLQKYSEPNMESGIESSSSSTVTKMRRSVENVDKTLYVSMHDQSVLSIDNSATKPPHLTSSIPPIFKSLQTMSEKSEIRNLGWAASYLFPSILTTKPASSEAERSSPVSEVQSLPSEALLYPVLTAHEGGYTFNNNQQQERNVPAFISEDRKNRGAGPVDDFTLLPILETEQHQDGRQKSNLFLVMIPSILAILFLCGLLYFMYRYRLLRRQLNSEQVPELPELRPLQCDLENV